MARGGAYLHILINDHSLIYSWISKILSVLSSVYLWSPSETGACYSQANVFFDTFLNIRQEWLERVNYYLPKKKKKWKIHFLLIRTHINSIVSFSFWTVTEKRIGHFVRLPSIYFLMISYFPELDISSMNTCIMINSRKKEEYILHSEWNSSINN